MRKGEGDPLIPGRLPQLELVEPYTGLVPADRQAVAPTEEQLLEVGSNNWAVSGALSITGQVMVVNDPHRRLENPSLRYYAHLNAPGWNVIGASEPPFVGVNAGHNDRVAWGVHLRRGRRERRVRGGASPGAAPTWCGGGAAGNPCASSGRRSR